MLFCIVFGQAEGNPDVSTITLEAAEGLPVSAQTLVDVLQWHASTNADRPHIRLYSDEGGR